LAGKVIVQDGNKYKTKLININKPALYIPGLPVELNTVNAKTTFIKLNKETNLVPVIGLSNAGNGKADGAKLLWSQVAAQAGVPADKISGFELSAYDLQKPTLGGFRNEFVLSGRQDNLMMTYGAIEGLLHSLSDDSLKADPNVRVASIFDHEEVGSSSRHGAGSTLLPNVISRVVSSQSDSKKDPTLYDQGIAKSFLVSADQGHAQHPNYPTKIESNNAPVLNEGPTLKVHLGQRYSTNVHTGLVLQLAAKAANVTIQTFLNRNDGSPGSTIGPILSTLSGIPTIDIGNSQFSMHSAREISGTLDVLKARDLFTSYFRNFPQITAQLDSDIDE
jgi:aspartyl aminopeptidase